MHTPHEDVELLAESGFPILPLRPGQKIPETSPFFAPRGSHDATTDIEQIRRWAMLSSGLNWGAALPGALVADFDKRHGGERADFDFPLTWETETGGGGHHVFFSLRPGTTIAGGNNKIAQGVDAKTGRNSYAAIPPSRTEGPYRWKPGRSPFDIPLAPAPAWLIDRLTPPPAPPPRPFVARTDDEARVRDALLRIPAHDRDVWLRVGMALKSHFGERGRNLWDAWSATCPDKFDPKAQAKVWRSFRRGGVGIGTIFYLSSRRAAYA